VPERPTIRDKTIKKDAPLPVKASKGLFCEEALDKKESDEGDEALGSSQVRAMRQWTDKTSRIHSAKKQNVHEETGAMGGDVHGAKLSPI